MRGDGPGGEAGQEALRALEGDLRVGVWKHAVTLVRPGPSCRLRRLPHLLFQLVLEGRDLPAVALHPAADHGALQRRQQTLPEAALQRLPELGQAVDAEEGEGRAHGEAGEQQRPVDDDGGEDEPHGHLGDGRGHGAAGDQEARGQRQAFEDVRDRQGPGRVAGGVRLRAEVAEVPADGCAELVGRLVGDRPDVAFDPFLDEGLDAPVAEILAGAEAQLVPGQAGDGPAQAVGQVGPAVGQPLIEPLRVAIRPAGQGDPLVLAHRLVRAHRPTPRRPARLFRRPATPQPDCL